MTYGQIFKYIIYVILGSNPNKFYEENKELQDIVPRATFMRILSEEASLTPSMFKCIFKSILKLTEVGIKYGAILPDDYFLDQIYSFTEISNLIKKNGIDYINDVQLDFLISYDLEIKEKPDKLQKLIQESSLFKPKFSYMSEYTFLYLYKNEIIDLFIARFKQLAENIENLGFEDEMQFKHLSLFMRILARCNNL